MLMSIIIVKKTNIATSAFQNKIMVIMSHLLFIHFTAPKKQSDLAEFSLLTILS